MRTAPKINTFIKGNLKAFRPHMKGTVTDTCPQNVMNTGILTHIPQGHAPSRRTPVRPQAPWIQQTAILSVSLCEVSTLVSDQIIGFPFVSRIHMYPLAQQIAARVRRRVRAWREGS